MTRFAFHALPTEIARAYRAGKPDANGQIPEVHVSDGDGRPCRHCLCDIAAGEDYLILAHRPFETTQPYAEVGPIFLHAEDCQRFEGGDGLPQIFQSRDAVLIRGYGADERIRYGTGRAVATADLQAAVSDLLDQPDTKFVHIRSASNNCFQCRVEPDNAD